MKKFILFFCLTLVVGVTMASSEVAVKSVDDAPQTVIISDGQAHYFNDGNRCTINLDSGVDYGPDC